MSEAIWIKNNISLVPSFLMLHTEKHWKNWDWPGDEAKIMCYKHMSINRDKLDLFKTQFCHYEYMIAWKCNMHCWNFFFFFFFFTADAQLYFYVDGQEIQGSGGGYTISFGQG